MNILKNKKTATQKILALLLAVCTVLSCIPIISLTASEQVTGNGYTISTGNMTGLKLLGSATDTSESTETDDYIKIANARQLGQFATRVNNGETDINAKLTADIDLSGNEWVAIGTADNPYTGIFDGGNFTISNVSMTVESNNQGFFGAVSGGTVKNFTINGKIDITAEIDVSDVSNIESISNVGGVVGYATSKAVIENVTSYVNITDNHTPVTYTDANGVVQSVRVSGIGGIVANLNGGTVSRCSYDGTITSVCGSSIAGIVGNAANSSTVDHCTNKGNVTSENNAAHIGGIAGDAQTGTTIGYCINSGNITSSGGDCIAGIAAYANQNVKIDNCGNLGIVTCTADGDGFIGGILGYINNRNFKGISNCFNYGSIVTNEGKTAHAGAILGYNRNSGSVYSNNYYLDTSFTKAASDNAIDNVYSMTAEQFSSGEVAFKLGGDWKQAIGTDAYPNLTSTQSVYSYTNCAGNTVYTNENTADGTHTYDDNGICKFDSTHYQPAELKDGYYEICNLGQLLWFAEKVNNGEASVSGKLMNDIDATSVSYIGIGKDADHAFAGTFDGNNKTLKLALVSKEQYVAPFPYINGATVKNLTVTGTIKTTHKFAAGIVGRVLGGDVTLEKCLSYVEIDSTNYSGDGTHGGLIAVVAAGTTTINNCGFAGSIIGEETTSCGGIVGWTDSTVKIGNSFVAATFTLQNNNGNTFGRNPSYISLDNCYYLNALSEASVATRMSADSFASGEVAYKLNGSKNAGTWKQTIDSDSYPNFNGKDVYYGYVSCNDYASLGYTNNENASATKPAHSYDNGICKVCGAYEPCEGEGTAEKPYLIKNASNLYWFADFVNQGGENRGANAKLTANITVNSDVLKSDGTLNGNDSDFRAWTPIGNRNYCPYTGTFDGNGKTISGLYYKGSDEFVGLFGYIKDGATIKNVTLTDTYFESSVRGERCTAYVGGIVAYVSVYGENEVSISGCETSGAFIANAKGSSPSGDSTAGSYAGGLVGYATAPSNATLNIENCYNNGNVSATARGDELSDAYSGGLAGYATTLSNATLNIENCYNTGDVSAEAHGENRSTAYSGGLVGYAYAYYVTMNIENCYNTGDVSTEAHGIDRSDAYFGGLVGYASCSSDAMTLRNCYLLDTCTNAIGNSSSSANTDKVEVKTLAQFKSGEVTWLLNGSTSAEPHTWYQDLSEDGDKSPKLSGKTVYRGYLSCADDATLGFSNDKDVPQTKPDHTYSNGACIVCKKECPHSSIKDNFCAVCGKSFAEPTLKDGIYEISTVAELYWFAQNVNAGSNELKAKLVNDITVNPGKFDKDGGYYVNGNSATPREWTPIGTATLSLYNEFDGNGHTVSGLYCRVESGYAGFIGNMGAFTVKNLTIKNSYFEGETAGAVAAYSDGATFTVCAVGEDVYVKGNEAGGLVGHADGRIENCYSLANVSGKNYGGLVGSNYAAIENCYTNSMRPVGSNSASYGGSMKDVYYAEDTTDYSETDGDGYTTQKPTFEGATEVKDFTSGKMAYILQLNVEEAYRESTDVAPEIWKQTIGTDDYPNFTGKKVYPMINTGCYKNESEHYSNTKNTTYDAPHNYDNGFCTYCGGFQPAVKNDDGVYEIGNAGQLYWFAALVNGDFDSIGCDPSANAKLTADIIVNPGKFDEYGNYTPKASESLRMWTPIGQNSIDNKYEYLGTFDGAKNATENYTISGLYCNYSSESYIGLFACVGAEENTGNLGTVKNVNIDNSYFMGLNRVGGIAGTNNYGNIVNCHNLGATIVTWDGQAGGIVGTCTGRVENCSNKANVSDYESETGMLGGIAGTAQGNRTNSKIVGCTNFGMVITSGDSVGGIVGNAFESRIENCTNSGTLSGSDSVGGIVGYGAVLVKNCVNSGVVNGENTVGGIVGTNEQAIGSTIKVSRCVNSGKISGTGSYVGGIVGRCFNSLDNCKNTGEVKGQNYVGGVVGYNNSSVSASFNTGKITITGGGNNVGGVAGFASDTGSFDNCYYLDESANNNVGGDSPIATGTAVMYASAFASGQVTYFLNQGETNGTQVWYQTCGEGLPDFKGKTVYMYFDCMYYSRYANEEISDGSHCYDNGFCISCGDFQPAVKNSEGVYEIGNAGQLYWFAKKANEEETDINGKLVADITVNPGTFDENGNYTPADSEDSDAEPREWTPIGSNASFPYIGTFDGTKNATENYVISGLYISDAWQDFVGLVGVIGKEGDRCGTVKNVTLENCFFKGKVYVAGIVAHNYEGCVINCHIDNDSYICGREYVGGIAGVNSGKVENCTNSATVDGVNSLYASYELGGIVGYNQSIGEIISCSNFGTVDGYTNVGGIVGQNEGTVMHCYNKRNVTGAYYNNESGENIGGIAGIVETADGKVINCYNLNAVTSRGDYVGGIVGKVENGRVQNCYNYASVSTLAGYVGAIAGDVSSDNCVTNCYYLYSEVVFMVFDGDETPQNGIGTDRGSSREDVEGRCEAVTQERFRSGEIAFLLNGSTSEPEEGETLVWYQSLNTAEYRGDDYPIFEGKTIYRHTDCRDNVTYHNEKKANGHNYVNGFCTYNGCYEPCEGEGEAYAPYLIKNGGNLYWFAEQSVENGGIWGELTANIKINEDVLKEDGSSNVDEGTLVRDWTPIRPDTDYFFYGNFDGMGFTISGLYFNDSTADYVGLFGVVGSGGTVKNVKITDSYFSGKGNVGAIAGYNYYGLIQDCSSSATVKGCDANVGGIIGENVGNVERCSNSGKVESSSTNVGGICGKNDNYGTIYFVYNTGDVSGDRNVGGLIGKGESYSNVVDGYNIGSVYGTSYVGGVVGEKDTFAHFNRCFYLVGCATDSNKRVHNGVGGETDPVDDEDGFTIAATKTQFESGEITYLLNDENINIGTPDLIVWRQTLGTDKSPKFTGEIVYCHDDKYSNNENEKIASVTITWTAMSFSYNKGTWDTDTMTWKDRGWVADENCGTMTVNNTGTLDVTATFGATYTDSVNTYGISVSFIESDVALTDNKLTIAKGENKTVKVKLTGNEPSEYIETATTIGRITVTLSTE